MGKRGSGIVQLYSCGGWGRGVAHVYKHALENDSDGAARDLERVGSVVSPPVGIAGEAAGREPGARE